MKNSNILAVTVLGMLTVGFTVSAQDLKQETEDYKVERYDHLVLTTDDFRETIIWYKEVLGFSETGKQADPKEGIQLQTLVLGNFRLDVLGGKDRREVLNDYDMRFESYKYQLSGSMTIEVVDMQKTIERLREKDIAIVMGPYSNGITNTTSIDIKDNNGNKIRFNNYLRRY
ncbi:VOC family protein [Flagellimonas meridianipacifica]|uniref:Catechol 2,3-dioxygenase-like lactoylglutathione lyase family enzyme n=1 Tax=Flagellimonas meridianipacifica TaxID=1080225 RepID=A0A2T0MD15_9FLAO|nr:VOC family protein [Allomuricauda pacifica]PRX55366.1 catechol 2,3-dioxygenase-like lactoylglutathione lyase family enzyme [Allomuricauda pacifica]